MKDFIWFVRNGWSFTKGYPRLATIIYFPKAWKKFKKLQEHGLITESTKKIFEENNR